MYTTYCGKKIAKMADKEIIGLVEGLYESIYVVDCFGAKDIGLLETFIDALGKRGYEINEYEENENAKISIEKILK